MITGNIKHRKKEVNNAEVPFGGERGKTNVKIEKERTLSRDRHLALLAILMSTLSLCLHVFPFNFSVHNYFDSLIVKSYDSFDNHVADSMKKSLASADSHFTALIEKSLASIDSKFSELIEKSLDGIDSHFTGLTKKSLSSADIHFTDLPEKSLASIDNHATASTEKSVGSNGSSQPQAERHTTPDCRIHPTKCDSLCKIVGDFVRQRRFGTLENPKSWSWYCQGVLEYYRCVNAKKIVEVGVAWGAQTAYHLKNGMDFIEEHHVVDPFISGYDPNDPMSQQLEKAAPGYNPEQISADFFQGLAMDLGRDGMFLPEKNQTMHPPPGCHLRMHHFTSVDGAKLFGDLSVDAVFIDGLHTYEGVIDDINAWMSKIKVGGSLIFNDFTTQKFGVNKAIWEIAEKRNLKIKMIDRTNALVGGLESCAKGPNPLKL